jgi:hypothetical protein
MELADMLKENGVETLEEYNAKIKSDAITAANKDKEESDALLRKQIKDLEEIKAKQGGTLGETRKELDEMKSKLLDLEKGKMNLEKKPENAGEPSVKTEDMWKRENEAAEVALSNEDWDKLDKALKDAPEETRELAVSSEEARSAFRSAVLGSAKAPQETFRRSVQEKKLSVDEQIRQGLGLLKPNVQPSLRPSGSGFSGQSVSKQNAKPNPALLHTGSLRDMVQAHKGE